MSRRRWVGWVGRSLARLSYGYFVEPTWLEINRFEVVIDDLPASFDGFRILHLTDFHLCKRVPASLIDEAVRVSRQHPCDLIALTGDFIHAGFNHVSAIAQLLSQLSAPSGVLAVLGNHDYSVRNILGRRRYPSLPGAVRSALEQVSIRVLHNEHTLIERADGQLAVVGVADLWSREADLPQACSGLAASTPRIMLAHNPKQIENLAGQRCDLMLSGHTHGGQVAWSSLADRALHDPQRRLAGLHQVGSAQLYVNKGIGYTVRFRYRTRPEAAVFCLRSAQSAPNEPLTAS